MNLSPALHASLARQLHKSQRTRTQLEQFSRLHPSMDIENSHAIQSAWMALSKQDGRKVIGHKIGLTSRAMLRRHRNELAPASPEVRNGH